MKEKEAQEIGRRIKELRELRKWSQADLARQATIVGGHKVSQQNVADYEIGKAQRGRYLIEVARALNTTIEGLSSGRLDAPSNESGPAVMSTYVVLLNFTDQGLRAVKESPKRAIAFAALAKTFNVNVREILWTDGPYDLLLTVEAPDDESARALNLCLSALGNVRVQSMRAYSADEMSRIVARML